MSASEQVMRFSRKVETLSTAVFVDVANDVKESIVNGSPLTGAPGQPVDTGNLKSSWQLVFASTKAAIIGTNVKYARVIEDNTRGALLRSKVGGFHSVKLTLQGFKRIVDAVARRHKDGAA
jgi:hypothetical protein